MLTRLSVPMALALLCGPVQAGTVYSQDFEGAVGAEWSGSGSVQSTAGLSAFGFGSLHWRNDTRGATALTVNGLAPHTQISVSFNMALWDSIDEWENDQFIIRADGSTLYDSRAFGNYYPVDNIGHGPGQNITPAFTDFATPNFGYNSGYRDSARFVNFTFGHTASTLVITWQFPTSTGGYDESFGIDNVKISSDAVGAVPEPSTLALGVAGFGLLALLRRQYVPKS